MVIGLGVVIVAGFILVIAVIAMRLSGPPTADRRATAPQPGLAGAADPQPAAFDATLSLPAGARIAMTTATGTRLAILVRLPEGSDRVYFIDPANGAVTGILAVTAE